jgi:hypothetical protein
VQAIQLRRCRPELEDFRRELLRVVVFRQPAQRFLQFRKLLPPGLRSHLRQCAFPPRLKHNFTVPNPFSKNDFQVLSNWNKDLTFFYRLLFLYAFFHH